MIFFGKKIITISDEDWWLFPGFASAGIGQITGSIRVLGVRRPLLLDLEPTRSGSCSPCSHKRGVGYPTLKQNKTNLFF